VGRIVALIVAIGVGAVLGGLLFAIVHEHADVITAYATVALTLGTFVLAGYTAVLANDTSRASKLADRHHQEALNPLIAPSNIRGTEDRVAGSSPVMGGATLQMFAASAHLENVGQAAAVNVRFRVMFAPEQGGPQYPSANPDDWAGVGTIATGAASGTDIIAESGDGAYKKLLVDTTAPVAYRMDIRYRNIFGSEGSVTVTGDKDGGHDVQHNPPEPVTRALP
jgi:hypothetical protein